MEFRIYATTLSQNTLLTLEFTKQALNLVNCKKLRGTTEMPLLADCLAEVSHLNM